MRLTWFLAVGTAASCLDVYSKSLFSLEMVDDLNQLITDYYNDLETQLSDLNQLNTLRLSFELQEDFIPLFQYRSEQSSVIASASARHLDSL